MPENKNHFLYHDFRQFPTIFFVTIYHLLCADKNVRYSHTKRFYRENMLASLI